MQSVRNSIITSAVSTDQVSALFPSGIFVFPRGKFDRTGSTYRPPHHWSASQEESFSGFSFPSLLSKLSLQKRESRIMRVRSLTCLNKHFSTTQTVLRILCKRGLLAGLSGHSFCNNCSRHPNVEKVKALDWYLEHLVWLAFVNHYGFLPENDSSAVHTDQISYSNQTSIKNER